MALMKLSGLVSGLAGKLNGSQFNNSSSGLILQNKCQQKRIGSAAQLQWRQNFKLAANYWKTLTPEQQQANNDAAVNYPYIDRFGDTRYYNGYQLLLRSNSNLLSINRPLIAEVPLTPPVYASLVDVSFFSYKPFANYFVQEFNYPFGQPFPSNSTVLLSVSPAISAGVTNYSGKFFESGYNAINGEQILRENSEIPYLDTWREGLQVFAIARVIDNDSGIELFSGNYKSVISFT